MDTHKLLSDPGALAAIISVFLAAILSWSSTLLKHFWDEKHQRMQIRFSRRTEAPSILAESDINRHLRISYKGTDVSDLRFYSITIVNSGRQMINDFEFICEFDNNVQSIDADFPCISTKAAPTVQTDEPTLDQSNSTNNKFVYITSSFAVGQQITANFLFSNCKTDKFDIRFHHANYTCHDGIFSESPTLERNIRNTIYNIILFYFISQVTPLIPILWNTVGIIIVGILGPNIEHSSLFTSFGILFTTLSNLGDLVGVIIGLPFALKALQSALPTIPILARKLKEILER